MNNNYGYHAASTSQQGHQPRHHGQYQDQTPQQPPSHYNAYTAGYTTYSSARTNSSGAQDNQNSFDQYRYSRPAGHTYDNAPNAGTPPASYGPYTAGPQNAGYASYTQPQQHIDRSAEAQPTQTTRNNYQLPVPGQTTHDGQRYSSTAGDGYSGGRISHYASGARQETTDTTVSPAQVYDATHEYRRQAAIAEATAAKAAEQRAAQKLEEARLEEEKRRAEEAAARAEEERRTAEEEKARIDAAAAEAAKRLGSEMQKGKKTRKSEGDTAGSTPRAKPKKKDKNAEVSGQAGQAEAAAMTLMQAANSGATSSMSPDKAALEEQMRALFRKMREFNQADPEMLSRLWTEERHDHLSQEQVKSTLTKASGVAPEEQSCVAAASAGESSAQATTAKAKKAQGDEIPRAKKPKAGKPSKTTPPQSQSNPDSTLSASTATSKISVDTLVNANSPVPTLTATMNTTKPASTTTADTTKIAPASKAPSTIWTPDKKAAIAQAASAWLQQLAGNQGRVLAPEEISLILDSNPSYAQLCGEIELRGFTVDRAKFAKALLTAVPDVGKKRTPSADQTGQVKQAADRVVNEALADAEKQIFEGQKLVTAPSRKRASNQKANDGGAAPAGVVSSDNNAPTTSTGDLQGLEAVQQFVNGDASKAAAATTSTPTGSAKPAKTKGKGRAQNRQSLSVAPPTKQDLARKRNFSDLIDLTHTGSSDDEAYADYLPPAKRIETNHQLPTPPDTTGMEEVMATPGVAESSGTLVPPSHPGSDGPQPAVAPVLSNGPPAIASSAPPAAAQPTTSRTVPAAPVLPADHPARSTVMVSAIDRRKAIRRNFYDPTTIARDVLIACGRHPDMRHLNAHLESLRLLPCNVDVNSDLSTFRWDLIDAGGPEPGSGAEPSTLELPVMDDFADDEESNDDSVLGTHTQMMAAGVGGGSAVVQIPRPAFSTPQNRSTGQARKSEPQFRAHASAGEATRGRPPRALTSTATPSAVPTSTPGSASGYAALRQQQAAASGDPNAVKKKGRPVGWRKWMMADPAAYKGGSGGAGAGKVAKPAAKKKSPSPRFPVFKCEWVACGAELHNLATLRRHVHKSHGVAGDDGQYRCGWRDCGRIRQQTDPATGRVTSAVQQWAYDAVEPWSTHVEEKHIGPVAWRLGDGPTGGVSDTYESEVSESYMSDGRGRRITPRVQLPDAAAEAVAVGGGGRRGTAAEREADESRRQAEVRARDIGPGVDKEGAVLVGEAERRRGLATSNAGEVIDDDDE